MEFSRPPHSSESPAATVCTDPGAESGNDAILLAVYSFDDYEADCSLTAAYPGQGDETGIPYVTLGMCGEAGEVAEKVKKVLRDHGGHIDGDRREALIKECGDVLWYLTRLCTHLDVPLAEVARRNVVKLRDRMERGVLGGSGDNR